MKTYAAKTTGRKWKRDAAGMLALGVFALLLLRPAQTMESVSQSLSLCVNHLLPTVFPMLILADFLSSAGLPRPLQRLWVQSVGKCFGFPVNGSASALFGLLAGYPVGVKTAAALYADGTLSQKEAYQLCLSCVHPGISFSVLTVGVGMFRSTAAGRLLYGAALLSDLLAAKVAQAVLKPKAAAAGAREQKAHVPLSAAFTGAVAAGIRGITGMFGYILVFGVLQAQLCALLPGLRAILLPCAEVSAAALDAAQKAKPVRCAFSLGFGGFCLFLQLAEELKAVGVSPLAFLLTRLAVGGLSAAFTRTALALFPRAVKVFSPLRPQPKAFCTDPAGSVALLVVCVLFMTEILENHIPPRKKQKRNLESY